MLTFIATQIAVEKDKKDLMETFKSLDVDGNGVLTRAELKEGLLKIHGIAKNEKEIDDLIKMVDSNNSGSIDFSGAFYLLF
jgi:calcium-dependent protein kinase